MNLLILNYHRIELTADIEDLYALSIDRFKEHLKIIEESGVPVINLNASRNDPFCVALTFDDGYKTHLTEVAPLLMEKRYSASFFPIRDFVGKENRMNEGEIMELHKLGFEIGSHGITHNNLVKKSTKEIKDELILSKTFFEEIIGNKVKTFSFPYGLFNSDCRQNAKEAGYQKVLSTGLSINKMAESPFVLYRWNLTEKISDTTLQKILSSNGKLNITKAIEFTVKNNIKKVFGKGFTSKKDKT